MTVKQMVMKKNILFLTKTLNTGGVAIVSIFLANNLSKRGYNVSLFILNSGVGEQRKRVDDAVEIFYGNGIKYSKENVALLREVLKKKEIDIVVNQWGLHWMTIKMIREAQGELPIKVFTEYHSDPRTNGRLQNVNIRIDKTNSTIKKSFLKLRRCVINLITRNSMVYVYKNSDKYLLLSPSYKENFIHFTQIKNTDKLMVQTNPITLDKGEYTYDPLKKEKTVVFVGRLDNNAKRVLRTIDVWKQLESKHPDWNMRIIGDGPEMNNLKQGIADKHLQRITLEGFCNPKPFYEKASVIILVSEYEGFPLVLPEAMQYGLIPVVYGSYSAVYDIVDDDHDGKIFPYNKDGFDALGFAKKLESIMNMSDEERVLMQEKALKKSLMFSKDVILDQWESKFKSVE